MDQKDNDKNQPVSFDDKIDMSAFDDAINATAGSEPKVQHAIDVDKITLDNTPTTAAALEQQLSENPDMGLGGASEAISGEKKSEASDAVKSENPAPVAAEDPKPPVEAEKPEATAPSNTPTSEENVDLDNLVAESEAQPADVAPAAPAAPEKSGDSAKPQKTSLASMSLGDAAAKVGGSTRKALGAMKPKNTFGVVALAIGIGIVVLGITVAVLFFTA